MDVAILYHAAALRLSLVLTLSITLFPPPCSALQSPASVTDHLALLSFKSMISDDPLRALDSWNHTTSLQFCRWRGVTCGLRHPERVTALDLASLDLAGTITPSLANLTFLQRLNLPNNRLIGSIPPELGSLSRLRYLNLSSNSLQGELPSTLSRCPRLQVISLRNNRLQGGIPSNLSSCLELKIISLQNNLLTGDIPAEFGSLPKLVYLDLGSNNLTGDIPASLGNLSFLLALDVSANALSGVIPPSLGHLSSLVFLYLYSNGLSGGIPSSLGQISSLVYVYLYRNSHVGSIPDVLGNLSSLQYLDVSFNNLTGGVPASFGNLSALSLLDVTTNTLSGGIPPSLGRLSSLTVLALTANALSGGIPPSLGSLSSLYVLELSHNKLTGMIPSSLYNLSGIQYFGVADNQLVGTIPHDIGQTLPGLQRLYMYFNQFHGPIPMSLANASGLNDIELTGNNFSGTIPRNLGTLQALYWLNLNRNQLEAGDADSWSFITSLTNCSDLQVLQLDQNRLGGTLPASIANLSTRLGWLGLGVNQISGSLPAEIGNLVNLTVLTTDDNLLAGNIPITIGKLHLLQTLDLSGNKFTGSIPTSFGNLTQLNELHLEDNDLTGIITPQSLSNCQALEYLDLSYNKLTGAIPKELVSLSSLSRYLGLSHNSLIGSLPPEVGSLKNLKEFDVSENELSGEIPSSIGQCQIMESLHLEDNLFRGTIPPSLSNLKGLQQLDLSSNNLSGRIPEFFGSFTFLYYLNLSFNNFEDQVPTEGIFANASGVSVLGNDKLCGGDPTLRLPPCPVEKYNRRHGSLKLELEEIIPIAVVSLCSFIVICSLLVRHRLHSSRKKSSSIDSMEELHTKVSYSELLKATDEFSSDNLVGVGSFGSVYKGIMNFGGEKVVAVKVLNLQRRGASRSFMAECNALRNIRHRNLIKILTVCSSVDFKGNDFKALVFEFMPNGSLEKWLHPKANEQFEARNLSLIQRVDIALDIASALDYLHHYGRTPIVHCDLKPSNVLLDDDMTAHVGDFGLSKFLAESFTKSSHSSTRSIGVKGTIGYVPPEYGMANQVSTEGDVYSYGILLLELFTGKRPTDDALREGHSLQKFVEMAFPDRVMDIIDPRLLIQEKGDYEITRSMSDSGRSTQECLVSVLRIGLSCSKESPRERIKTGDVIKEMDAVKDIFNRKGIGGERRNKDRIKGEGPSHQTHY